MRYYMILESNDVTEEMKNNSLICMTSQDENKKYTILAYKGVKPACFNSFDAMLAPELKEIMFNEDNENIWYNIPPE
tara:strand:- start:1516 stop:1746 length:231 start_codon:yes stop_codon:yes gene_type:complete